MKEQFGGQMSEQPREGEPSSPYIRKRDRIKEYERQKMDDPRSATMEVQGAKYEVALHTLMERSGDDAELVNAMNGFLDRLNHAAALGRPGESLGKNRRAEIISLFQEAAERLNGISE